MASVIESSAMVAPLARPRWQKLALVVASCVFLYLTSSSLESFATVPALGNALIWGVLIGEIVSTHMVLRQPVLGDDPMRRAILAAKGAYTQSLTSRIASAYQAKRNVHYWRGVILWALGLFAAEQVLFWLYDGGLSGTIPVSDFLGVAAMILANTQQTRSARLYFRRFLVNNRFDKTFRTEDVRDLEEEIGGWRMGRRFWWLGLACVLASHLSHGLVLFAMQYSPIDGRYLERANLQFWEGMTHYSLEPYLFLSRFVLIGSFVLMQVVCRDSCERTIMRVTQPAARERFTQIHEEDARNAPTMNVAVTSISQEVKDQLAEAVAKQLEAPRWEPPLLPNNGTWRD
jgi:hypothetical protein